MAFMARKDGDIRQKYEYMRLRLGRRMFFDRALMNELIDGGISPDILVKAIRNAHKLTQQAEAGPLELDKPKSAGNPTTYPGEEWYKKPDPPPPDFKPYDPNDTDDPIPF